jgi:hypothetical protein
MVRARTPAIRSVSRKSVPRWEAARVRLIQEASSSQAFRPAFVRPLRLLPFE